MQDSTPTPYFPDNLQHYAAWVAKYGLLAPYGVCQCGCGQPTDITDGHVATTEKYSKGDFLRFRSMHSLQAPWYDSLEDYFWRFCVPGLFTDCWVWQGPIHSSGYGAIHYGGRCRIASRVSWEIHNNQPFPKGKVACHSCDNRPCVNPYHIWPGTRQDNNADMVEKQRQARGEQNHKAKLTEHEVLEIRKLYSEGHRQPVLAMQFRVASCTIWAIVHRKTWSHIP